MTLPSKTKQKNGRHKNWDWYLINNGSNHRKNEKKGSFLHHNGMHITILQSLKGTKAAPRVKKKRWKDITQLEKLERLSYKKDQCQTQIYFQKNTPHINLLNKDLSVSELKTHPKKGREHIGAKAEKNIIEEFVE